MTRTIRNGTADIDGAGGGRERVLLAVLIGMAGLSLGLLAWQAIDPRPAHFAGISIDRLTASLTLLVASVGAATLRFSLRYLDGDTGRNRFFGWLGFTVATAYVLMLSTNLALLFVAWSLTSIGLHQLLTFYPDRVEAKRASRKKFLISRLGDVALLSAIYLIWSTSHTLDMNVYLERGPHPEDVDHTIAQLIVLAAMTKSAQFPFHSWLPETMESPTPVSALMHAGIINAGGALLIRFAPLIVREPSAYLFLTVIGTVTACVGMVAMWAQVKVKRTLAWSTVSQMGFMMVQCGLGVFPAAALHIAGHGCYKAWSFLRSGTLPKSSSYASPVSPARSLTLVAIGAVSSIPAIALASILTGFTPWHSPGELALASIVGLSIGQLWVVSLGAKRAGIVGSLRGVAGAIGSTVAVTVILSFLYQGASRFLMPVLGDVPAPEGALAWVAAIIPMVAFAGLTVVHAFLPALGKSASGRALHVHALHGFYFGAIADRVVGQIWGLFGTKGVRNA